MGRHQLIREIFDKVPASNRGINRLGFHVITLKQGRINLYATLEKLSLEKLQSLANSFNIPLLHSEVLVDAVSE